MDEETGGVDREAVMHHLRQVMQRDNSLSRCCAIRGLARLGAEDTESTRLFIRALLDPDPDVRADAVEALGRLRTEEAVEPLLANIEGDPEGDVRIIAVKALAEIGSTSAVGRLVRCIRESGYPELDHMIDDADFGACWEVQSGALKALGSIGDAGAVQPVIEFLADEDDEDLQENAFQVLAELDDTQTEEFLVERLKNGRPLTRRQAAQALSSIANMRASDTLPVAMLSALNDALVDPEPSVRTYAAKALGASSNPMIAVSLTLLLNDPEPEVRHEVASLLGRIRGAAIVDRLHDLLQQADSKSKPQLVRILGEIADAGSCLPLHEVLRNCDPVKDRPLLYETLIALGAIGEMGPEKDLAEILADAEIQYTIRVQAARALGHIYRNATTDEDVGEQQQGGCVRKALTDAVDDENAQVSYAAITALIDIDKKQAVDRLTALLCADVPAPDRVEPQATVASKEDMEVNDIPEAMRDMVGDHGPGTSTLAAILAQPAAATDSREPEPESEQQAETRSKKRILAARLLGNISNPGAPVMAALIEAGASHDAAVRKEAISSLGRIGDPKSVSIILDGLNAKHSDVRLASLDALEKFNGMEKVSERLASLFSDPDPTIRERIITLLDCAEGSKAKVCLLQALEDKDCRVCRVALARLAEDVGDEQAATRAVELMFKFGGELRTHAAAALRKMNDYSSTARLLEMLNDENQEEFHWICIDALAEMYATDSIEAERPAQHLTGEQYDETVR